MKEEALPEAAWRSSCVFLRSQRPLESFVEQFAVPCFLAVAIRQAAAASRFAWDGLRQVAGNVLSKGAEIEVARRTAYRGIAAAAVARTVGEAVVLSAESGCAAELALGCDVGAGTVEDAIGIVSRAERLARKRAARTGVSAADYGGAEARHQGSSGTEKASARRAFR